MNFLCEGNTSNSSSHTKTEIFTKYIPSKKKIEIAKRSTRSTTFTIYSNECSKDTQSVSIDLEFHSDSNVGKN